MQEPGSLRAVEAREVGSGWRRRVALIGFAGAAAYCLLTEHRAHTIQALPWVILLLCPLLHVFMHRGPGAHGPGRDGSSAGGSR